MIVMKFEFKLTDYNGIICKWGLLMPYPNIHKLYCYSLKVYMNYYHSYLFKCKYCYALS